MLVRSLGALLLTVVVSGSAWATTWNVTSITDLKNALNGVSAGDIIEIQYDVYQVTTASDPKHWFKRGGTVDNPIVIRGIANAQGDRPVLDANGQAIERGIFYLWDYNPNYVVENLEFRNSRGRNVYSNNAAAAYILADNITFRNCYSHDNDNGWFSSSSADNTLLEYCHTAYNGKPAGYPGGLTHNHYVASQSITVRGCYIHHSTEGQNFKSRASHVVFEGNLVENDGNYCWELASNNVDNSLMIGNVIVKGPSASNSRIIGLCDGTASGVHGTLTMINNTIVATAGNNRYVWSHSLATTDLVLYNNVFYGSSLNVFDLYGSGTQTGSHNWFKPGMSVPAGITDSLFGDDPGFVNRFTPEYHLRATAGARDVGTNTPQWLNRYDVWETRLPQWQYLKHAWATPRPSDGQLDMGAYECVVGDIDYDGDVDLDDLTEFTIAMNGPNQMPGHLAADCDADGDCDLVDVAIFPANFSGPY